MTSVGDEFRERIREMRTGGGEVLPFLLSVFVVTRGFDYEGEAVIGVAASLEQGKQLAEKDARDRLPWVECDRFWDKLKPPEGSRLKSGEFYEATPCTWTVAEWELEP